MSRIRGLVAVIVAGGLIAACNANSDSDSSSEPQSAERGGTLYVLSSAPELDLDPARSQNLGTSTIHLVVRGLTSWKVSPDKAAEVVPDMATDTGTPTDGGKVWTYHLKDGLKYSDGTPITAQDIKYSVERSFAPSLAGGLSYHKSLLEGASSYQGPYDGKHLDSVETPDETTIVFHLTKPFGDWPWIVSMPAFGPVPEDKDDPNTYGQHPVSSGPYQIDSFDQGKEVVFTRNPEWSKDTDPARTASPDKIVMEMGLEDTVVINRLIADRGNDQYATSTGTFVQAPLLPEIQGKPDVESRMAVSSSGALTYLAMNTQKSPLDDVQVRQAIQYAVNKQAVQVAAGGAEVGGGIASTLIAPGIPGHEDFNQYEAPPNGDPDKAKDLLTQAGYGDRLKLSLLCSNDSDAVDKAEAIQAGLREAGIDVKLDPQEDNAYTADATGDDPKYDLVLGSWLPDYPSALGAIQPLFAKSEIGGGGYNLSRFDDPEVDSQIDAAIGETDPKKAGAMWAELDRQIMDAAPVVPLLYAHNAFLRGSKVAEFFVPPYPPYLNILTLGLAE